MKNKSYLVATCVVIIAVCAVAFSGHTRTKDNPTQEPYPEQQKADDLPEHVRYAFLFRHLSHLKKRAEKHQRQGKDGSGFQRRFKNVLDLDDEQFVKLNEIALSCESELTILDKKAEGIIKEFKKQYPDGIVPEGVIIPPPPAELRALQEERNRTILRARDRVQEALGGQEFNRFAETVKLRLTPDIKRASPAAPAP